MKEKILVINDDDSVRELTQLILQTKGYETLEASSGAAGIEHAYHNRPDLILLDIIMPEMDGYETCQRLKASSVTKDIPVLFFSSLTSPKDKIKGLALGAVDFINNVADQGELIARVQIHLHIQSLTRSLMDSNAQLIQKQKILDDDLHAAAAIQRSFLPSPNLEISGMQLASIWLPANLLGGDIFNTIQWCDRNKIICYMIDVSGHDVPSALVTVSVSQFLHQQNDCSTLFLSPREMMLELDKEYPIERFDRYFTVFYLVLDLSNGVISYSSAGHPSAVVLSKSKGLISLGKGGTIIGLTKSLPFEEGEEVLTPGDKVLLYTDGVTEMRNQNSEQYGTERLYTLLENSGNESVADIVNKIQNSLKVFGEGVKAQDDISILCFEYTGL
jgi:sigma-B regulation protein RsbU (phosphoserine phosphatase)